jgi:hypothetical protein
VYRDVLHGAGVVEVLMAALTDAAVLTDLLLVQVNCERWAGAGRGMQGEGVGTQAIGEGVGGGVPHHLACYSAVVGVRTDLMPVQMGVGGGRQLAYARSWVNRREIWAVMLMGSRGEGGASSSMVQGCCPSPLFNSTPV